MQTMSAALSMVCCSQTLFPIRQAYPALLCLEGPLAAPHLGHKYISRVVIAIVLLLLLLLSGTSVPTVVVKVTTRCTAKARSYQLTRSSRHQDSR
jgi:hypothetical protein